MKCSKPFAVSVWKHKDGKDFKYLCSKRFAFKQDADTYARQQKNEGFWTEVWLRKSG